MITSEEEGREEVRERREEEEEENEEVRENRKSKRTSTAILEMMPNVRTITLFYLTLKCLCRTCRYTKQTCYLWLSVFKRVYSD